MNYGIIVTCAFVIAAVAAVGVGAGIAVNKIRHFSRSLFGTSDISKAIRDQKKKLSETPKSLHGMTTVYRPQINKDFPEFDCELYLNKAQAVLRGYFEAVESGNITYLPEDCSDNLKNHTLAIIGDLNSRGLVQHFDDAVLHDTQISRYIKDGKTVTVLFETSVGYYCYTSDERGNVVSGDKEMKTQTVYEIGLVYVQDIDKVGNFGSGYGINCPNCGAPIKNLGIKVCEYCGSSVSEVNYRAWKFDSIKN